MIPERRALEGLAKSLDKGLQSHLKHALRVGWQPEDIALLGPFRHQVVPWPLPRARLHCLTAGYLVTEAFFFFLVLGLKPRAASQPFSFF